MCVFFRTLGEYTQSHSVKRCTKHGIFNCLWLLVMATTTMIVFSYQQSHPVDAPKNVDLLAKPNPLQPPYQRRESWGIFFSKLAIIFKLMVFRSPSLERCGPLFSVWFRTLFFAEDYFFPSSWLRCNSYLRKILVIHFYEPIVSHAW